MRQLKLQAEKQTTRIKTQTITTTTKFNIKEQAKRTKKLLK